RTGIARTRGWRVASRRNETSRNSILPNARGAAEQELQQAATFPHWPHKGTSDHHFLRSASSPIRPGSKSSCRECSESWVGGCDAFAQKLAHKSTHPSSNPDLNDAAYNSCRIPPAGNGTRTGRPSRELVRQADRSVPALRQAGKNCHYLYPRRHPAR